MYVTSNDEVPPAAVVAAAETEMETLAETEMETETD